jgi:isopenicillin N synthase-like dioxygenase
MTVVTAENDNFRVPTIDISPYVRDPTSIEASKVIAQVREACMTIGFFELVGHGVERSLQDQIIEAARRLFTLSHEEKKKMDRKLSGLNNRGYELMGTQVLQQGAGADQKEVSYSRTGQPLSFQRTLLTKPRASTSPKTSP